MAHEINMYAIVQKEQMGLDKAVEEVKFRMSRYSVTPNMLIIPPQLGLYMSLAPEAKLTYPLGGPAAQAAFDAGLKGFEASAFRGLGVLTSTPYEVSDGMQNCDLNQHKRLGVKVRDGQVSRYATSSIQGYTIKLKRSPMQFWSFKTAAA